jgi:hypothetical protein
MLKRFFLACIFATALIAIIFVYRTPQKVKGSVTLASPQAGASVRPFTALVYQTTSVPGNSIPTHTQFNTFAVRSDGSTAALFYRADPAQNGNTVYFKKILDVPGKKKVVLNPFSQSSTTYPLLPKAVEGKAVKPMVACEGVPDNPILGYAVMRTEEKLGPDQIGPGMDEMRIQSWLASSLNCIPIRREFIVFKGGKELQHTIESYAEVIEGEPDPKLFEVPTGYVERAPSEAMKEASRRYPNAKWLDCGSCDQTPKDEAYFHALQQHRQR